MADNTEDRIELERLLRGVDCYKCSVMPWVLRPKDGWDAYIMCCPSCGYRVTAGMADGHEVLGFKSLDQALLVWGRAMGRIAAAIEQESKPSG